MVTEKWKRDNWNRYECKSCGMRTHHKSKYERHIKTTKHFLYDTIQNAPKDLKILVAQFLPMRSLRKMDYKTLEQIIYLKLIASPLSQICVEEDQPTRTKPSRACALQLFELCRYCHSNVGLDSLDDYLQPS